VVDKHKDPAGDKRPLDNAIDASPQGLRWNGWLVAAPLRILVRDYGAGVVSTATAVHVLPKPAGLAGLAPGLPWRTAATGGARRRPGAEFVLTRRSDRGPPRGA
jgi:hypothetical protein